MIRIFDDPEYLSRAAADLFMQSARQAVNERGRFTVALSGGHTPRRTYQLLARRPWRDRTPWPNIHFFWGDERCVAADDDRNNALMARRALLDHVAVPSSHVHPMRCGADPRAGAARYSALLRAHLSAEGPALDLVFLGLGQNGHTASLFPWDPVIGENKRWAAEVYVTEQGEYRITLTPVLINAARVVAFLVSGGEKAQILEAVLEGAMDSRQLPAQTIRPRSGRLIWMLDRAAALRLHAHTLQGESSYE